MLETGDLILVALIVSIGLNLIMVAVLLTWCCRARGDQLPPKFKKQDDARSDVPSDSSAVVLYFQGSEVYHSSHCGHVFRKGCKKPIALRPCKTCLAREVH